MVKNIINETELEVYKNDVNKIIKFILKKFNIKKCIYNVTFISEDKIKEINNNYRNKDVVTDVISFAFEEEKDVDYNDIRFLGEIYICSKRAYEQAKEYGHSEKREICYLCVHGFLHLLGYDHIKEEDKKVMREKEEEILNEYEIYR